MPIMPPSPRDRAPDGIVVIAQTEVEGAYGV